MKKIEYTRLFQEILKGKTEGMEEKERKRLELTQGEIDLLLDVLEESIVKVYEEKENVKINGFLKIDSKERKAKSGVSHLPGKEGREWSNEACTVPTCEFTKSFIEEHKILKL